MGKVKRKDKADRRILDVDVREVSLVDRAANLRRFLILKRLEEDEMTNFEKDPVEIQKGDTNEVMEWLRKALEGDDAPTDEIKEVIKLLEVVEKANQIQLQSPPARTSDRHRQ